MTYIRNGGAAIKAVTFAIVHFLVAFSIAYLLTGDVGIAGALALIEPLANTVAYYFHERVWQWLPGSVPAQPIEVRSMS